MEQQFSLEQGRGRLTIREEGPRAVVRAELADDGRGLYKAWLLGQRGSFPLGTLMPGTGRNGLELGRTLSVDSLRRQGVWPVTGARAELAFSFREEGLPKGWSWTEGAGDLFRDRALSTAVGRRGRALCRRDGAGWTLAYPYHSDREFPLPPLFCFARFERLGEGLFCLFSFDEKGWPVVPGSE